MDTAEIRHVIGWKIKQIDWNQKIEERVLYTIEDSDVSNNTRNICITIYYYKINLSQKEHVQNYICFVLIIVKQV